jgi:uncharacterized phage protein (TIGR01671 family)
MMNREIKFRAWNGISKEMWADIWFDYTHIYFGWDAEDNPLGTMPRWDTNPIMQYTGLKDKNGKEIYEGDIVRYYKDGYIRDPTPVTWGKYYDGEDQRFLCWITEDCPLSDYFSEVEVIGNIYKNPELLEKE